MKKCTNCGKELNDNAAFCDACGTKQNMASQMPQQGQPAPTAQPPKKKKTGCLIAIIIAAVLIIVFLCAMCSSSDTNTNTNTATSTNTTAPQVETSKPVADNSNNAASAPVEEKPSADSNIPTEYKSALKSAKSYSDIMHMSKQGIYDQLTSEYGDKFTAEAAQYAVDNLQADYKENALKSAESYQEIMSMSPAAIHDQLTSEYGGKFTQEEADYAIANLK